MRIPRWTAVCLALVAVGALVVVTGMAFSPAGSAPAQSRPIAIAQEITPAPASDPTPTSPAGEATAPLLPTITVAAVGDIMFDSAPKRLIKAKGGNAPFSALVSQLRGADVTLGNLECPLSVRGHAVAGKTFTFQGDPRGAKGLQWAGFDLVSLANNHARDYGVSALRDTFQILGRAGLAWAGAGVNRAAAWKPAIIERGGARIAFLAFSEIGPGNFVATGSKPGTAFTSNISAVTKAIKAAHAKADYVIVSFHWGVERSYSPTARQVNDGRAAIRAGADMVLSHHPHVLQGVEFYRRGIIAYSLGNFVFSPGTNAGRDSMILHASLTPAGVTSVSAEPVYIGSNGRPTPQKGASARRILGIVKRTSNGRGTHVSISGTLALLTP